MTLLKARPTTYNGIEMRSRLEARVAAFLSDELSLEWHYEPRAFASGSDQYLPDFLIEPVYTQDGKATRLYLEVKGQFPEPFSKLKALADRMGCIWVSDPLVFLGIATGDSLEQGWFLLLPSFKPVHFLHWPGDPSRVWLGPHYWMRRYEA